MGKNIGKTISKKLSGKYSQKLLDHAKQSATDALKTSSKRIIQKRAEETGDLTGNKIAKNNFSRRSPQNNSQPITNEQEEEIPKERFIASKKLLMFWN